MNIPDKKKIFTVTYLADQLIGFYDSAGNEYVRRYFKKIIYEAKQFLEPFINKVIMTDTVFYHVNEHDLMILIRLAYYLQEMSIWIHRGGVVIEQGKHFYDRLETMLGAPIPLLYKHNLSSPTIPGTSTRGQP